MNYITIDFIMANVLRTKTHETEGILATLSSDHYYGFANWPLTLSRKTDIAGV
jgi:hypothetical protein